VVLCEEEEEEEEGLMCVSDMGEFVRLVAFEEGVALKDAVLKYSWSVFAYVIVRFVPDADAMAHPVCFSSCVTDTI
jgi:hypothetical protein